MKMLLISMVMLSASIGFAQTNIVRKSRHIQLPPSLPAPPIRKTNSISSINLNLKAPVSIEAFPNDRRHKVFYGKFSPQTNQLLKTTLVESVNLIPVSISFTSRVPIYWSENDIRISDIVTISAFKFANSGAQIEYTSDFNGWSFMAGFGSYPEDETVNVTWIIPIDQEYHHIFFRAHR